MKYRTLTADGDYSFGAGAFLFDIEAVAQAIKTRLLHLYGEWWEDTEDGLPLFQNILGVFGTQENIAAIDLIISDRILGTEGVEEIKSYSSSFENRVYSAQCTVKTSFGNVEVDISENVKMVEVRY